jgi:hypothetical protein
MKRRLHSTYLCITFQNSNEKGVPQHEQRNIKLPKIGILPDACESAVLSLTETFDMWKWHLLHRVSSDTEMELPLPICDHTLDPTIMLMAPPNTCKLTVSHKQ